MIRGSFIGFITMYAARARARVCVWMIWGSFIGFITMYALMNA